MDLYITNCGILNYYYYAKEKKNVLIENGRITSILDKYNKNYAEQYKTINAEGLTLMPSFVDLHAHFRDPGFTHKEDLQTGCMAAVKGGYTTVNCMANTNPVCDNAETAKDVVHRANKIGLCDVFQTVSLTKNFDGETLCDFANTDKRVTRCVSEDGHGIANSDIFYDGLKKCADAKLRLLIHAEDERSKPRYSEDLETIRDLYLTKAIYDETKAALGETQNKTPAAFFAPHFCHVSTAESVRAINNYKSRGLPVTYEVTPHHIALSDRVAYNVKPPLRTETDRQFLIDCIKFKHVDAIATDHAPHSQEDKLNGASGMVGLETAFSVCYTRLVKSGVINIVKLSKLMSRRPAEILGIDRGVMKLGAVADLVLVDLNKKVTIDSGTFVSKSKNTPFDGMKFYGEVQYTIKNGNIVYNREENSFGY